MILKDEYHESVNLPQNGLYA